jgi:heme exporter protein D
VEWASWSDFWSMGGRGFFVWSAFGVTLVCLVAELVALRRASRLSRRRLARMQQWDLSSGESGS